MDRRLIVTEDGSHTVEIPGLQVTYHSRHGAIQESLHVFIQAGLQYWMQNNPAVAACHVFEMGFGTGLNALLTLMESEKGSALITYTAVELSPLEPDMVQHLNYCEQLGRNDMQPKFAQLHSCAWGGAADLAPQFRLKKINESLSAYTPDSPADIIFYDAFAPLAQPELWTGDIFQKLFNMINPGGVLVTYCSKSSVQRAMKAAGFTIEKLSGPPGKREMLRALKHGPHHANE